jgi:hypothetical protein
MFRACFIIMFQVFFSFLFFFPLHFEVLKHGVHLYQVCKIKISVFHSFYFASWSCLVFVLLLGARLLFSLLIILHACCFVCGFHSFILLAFWFFFLLVSFNLPCFLLAFFAYVFAHRLIFSFLCLLVNLSSCLLPVDLCLLMLIICRFVCFFSLFFFGLFIILIVVSLVLQI